MTTQAAAPRLTYDPKFIPCEPEDGDEIYPNGIFEFNITRLNAHIGDSGRFRAETIAVEELATAGSGARLDPQIVESAVLSRPVILAEIAPGRFNLIDGHHRVAKAKQTGVANILAYRVPCPQHLAFLTTARAYEKYIVYWNSQVDADR